VARLWYLVLVCVLLGAAFIIFGDSNNVPLLYHLGIAFVVAAILAISAELAFSDFRNSQQKTFQEQLNKNVLYAVLKYFFPESIFNQIQRHLLKVGFIRRDFLITNILEWNEDKTGLIADITEEYYVEKLVSHECNYEIVCLRDYEFDPDEVKFKKLEIYNMDEVLIQEFGNATPDIGSLVSTVEQGHSKQLQYSFDMTKYLAVKVKVRCEIKYKPVDYMVWMMKGMTDGFGVRYVVPADIKVSLVPNHPDSNEFRYKGDKLLFECKYDGGFLPYQGISANWEKIPADKLDNLSKDAMIQGQ
jgi:hypothetical protein